MENLEKAFEAVTRIIQDRERQEHENKILGMIDQQKSSMERGERNRAYIPPLMNIIRVLESFHS